MVFHVNDYVFNFVFPIAAGLMDVVMAKMEAKLLYGENSLRCLNANILMFHTRVS